MKYRFSSSLLKSLFFIQLITIILLIPKISNASLLKQCGTMFKEWVIPPRVEVIKERTTPRLKELREKYQFIWLTEQKLLPEKINGLSTNEALKLLKGLKTGGPSAWKNRRNLRNRTYKISLNTEQNAIVKHTYLRSEMGDAHVNHTQNYVKFDVLAFALDRYLETNIVPPAITLSEDTIAELEIKSSPRKFKPFSEQPENLLTATHTRLLDTLLTNPDRINSDNMRTAPHKGGIAIDFDLAHPVSSMGIFEAAEECLFAKGIIVDSSKHFIGRKMDLPGIFSRTVVENLRNLNQTILSHLATEHNVKLNEKEMNNILSWKETSLEVIDYWISTYGENLILVPGK